MLTLALVLALGQTPQHRLFLQPNLPRGESYAFFEFAPTSGAGMGTACACAAITGAKGEAVTTTRAGNATCSKQGNAATGIANADLVECAANLPRVENQAGLLMLRNEGARTNALPRFIEYTNVAWADVATPTPTTGQTSPFTGTYASSAVQYNDNDAVAFEGRTQTITVTAAVSHVMHCYVKAGTLASATVSLDGTTASISGLSSSTWSIVEVVDASSSGVAIVAQILNGALATDTGTVIWGGCQVEQGAYRTSITPTVAASVTRNAETVTAPVAVSQQTRCQAATVSLGAGASNDRIWAMTRVLAGSGDFIANYTQVQARADVVGSVAVSATSAGSAFSGTNRFLTTWDGSTLTVFRNATQTAQTVTASTVASASIIGLGSSPAGASNLDGLVGRIQLDPSPSRCTP